MNKNSLIPAATVLLFKDSLEGPKVLMVKRSKRPPFENLYVFPGGKVDQDDEGSEISALCRKLDDAEASFQLNIGSGGLAYWVAAIRESFEEVGILMAELSGKQLGEDSLHNKKLKDYRNSINNGELSFCEMLVKEKLYLSLSNICPLSHWITPEIEKRRFNTRFFVAKVPSLQNDEHDGKEITDSLWITPEDALKEASSGGMQMIMPTIKNLESCCGFKSVEELIMAKKNIKPIDRPSILPKFFKKKAPGLDYFQVMRVTKMLDDALIKKITAPNGGVFTGGGTNTYIIGTNDLTLIDPGPIDESHTKNILDAYGDRIKRILVTHTHMDHSPLAMPLSKKLNVPVMGMTILDNMQYQDESFVPTLHLKDGDLIETDEYTVEAVHTPGHASNHLCYLIKEVNCLITGDHIMQGSTVVIAPPDGDMRDYLLSLKKLKNYKIDFLAPGHGEFIERPFETVDWIVNHRLERETKVINKLQEKGKISLEDLVLSVYDDVDPRLHRIALASLEAHLLKLEHDRVVELDGNLWRCIN